MKKYSSLKIILHLQKWMDSEKGQTFLNYAYSWGASIVILGTLFKLTHMPSANFWLFLGMGTEVLVFFIAGFDRPFEKNGSKADTDDASEGTMPAMEDFARRIGMMPDNEDTRMIKEVYSSIYDTYKHQLLKLNSQLTSIEKMDELLKIQNAYMEKLNGIYGKMLDSMRVKE